MTPIRIASKEIGRGCPCLMAAEIGINHNGDKDLAHQMLEAAAKAGADAVKFQNYRTEDFLSDRALTYEYVSQGRQVVESQYDMFKRCELPTAWLRDLREHCDRLGVIFFSTPTSGDGVEELVRVGAPLLKNGSDYLVHLPLVRTMARSGLPTVLSTGMATLAEVDNAVRAFREAGGLDLVLLHCTSSYPTPSADVHLLKIPTLAAAFGCPVGLSDHTDGIVAGVGAIALGACMIEKHFTLDKTLPGPDHRFSADPNEFRTLVDAVRTMETSLGHGIIGPTPSEEKARRDYRLSCVAARSLPAGHRIEEKDVAFRRPGTGVPPAGIAWLIGLRLRKSLPCGKVLEPGDFLAEEISTLGDAPGASAPELVHEK
jgi:N-acetylneuraminate synthase/N,N'-diacetyllegionaminate synthase